VGAIQFTVACSWLVVTPFADGAVGIDFGTNVCALEFVDPEVSVVVTINEYVAPPTMPEIGICQDVDVDEGVTVDLSVVCPAADAVTV